MAEQFELIDTFEVPPSRIYHAWLDAEVHAAMTGAGATCAAQVGGEFTAGDGYITGKNLELEKDRRIVQSWRTSEFADSDEDSRLEIILEPDGDGTGFRLIHSNIPDGQGDSYNQGWIDNYLAPMHEYFGD